MKKLLVVLALAALASCGNGTSDDTTKDSLNAVDSSADAQKENIDSSASAQKNTIDSVKSMTKDQIDSEAAAKKDSLKGK